MDDLEERVLTVPEAARLLRIGVRTYYAAAARGEVPSRRVGRRVVVPGALLERFLKGGEDIGTHDAPAAGTGARARPAD